MNVIKVKNLTKDYGDHCGIFNLNFTIKQGEIVGLIGQNGSGKTTTIKVLMNLIRPNSGSVEVFGKDYLKNEKEIKNRIGFVYDELSYYPSFTAETMRSTLKSFYTNWDDGLYNLYIKMFNIPENKSIHKMSKGMKMKLNIACSISHHAELLVMDEPTSGLDPVIREEILKVLLQIKDKHNVSILFSSHITSDLENIADKIIMLEKGRIIINDTLDAILKSKNNQDDRSTLEEIYLKLV